MNLRSWLRREPSPASIMLADLEIAVPDGRSKWAELDATIAGKAKRGDRVEAYDDDGTLLRAFVWNEGAAEPPAPTETAAAVVARSEDARLVEFARLIAAASDRGAERHAQAYQTAFNTMENLVNLVSNRLVAMETAWQKAMVATAQAQAEAIRAQQSGDAESPMAMLLPMLMGGMAPKTPTPPNGTSKE